MVTAPLMIMGVAAGYYYGYYTPERQDVTYNVNLARGASVLLDRSKQLVDTASLPIFNDINEVPAICTDNATKVMAAISQFEGYLNELEQTANVNQPGYIYGLAGNAAKTKARKVRAEAMVKQSRQVLADYSAMTTFLQGLADIRKEFIDITMPLTGTVDLNNYVYRTQELRADADAIDVLAARVADAQAPEELRGIQSSIATQYKETAAGYRNLADGLAAGNDARVDIAAHRIEAAIAQLDNNVQSQYAAVMKDSALIKEVSELPDKYVID